MLQAMFFEGHCLTERCAVAAVRDPSEGEVCIADLKEIEIVDGVL